MTLVVDDTQLALPPAPSALRHTSEAELVEQLVRRIRAQWPLRAVGLEVKSHGRARTDVCVALRDLNTTSPDLLVGIEAKLSSWRRALHQAVLNRFSVDLSMIALPAYRVTDVVVDACWDQGVGVLAVDPKWLHVVIPAVPASPDAALRDRAFEQLTSTRARGAESVATLTRKVCSR